MMRSRRNSTRTEHRAIACAGSWHKELRIYFAQAAVYQSLVDVDRTRAATGCGIIAATLPVIAVMLIVHGRLVYPIYGMRVDTPEAAALVITVFYRGLHAIYLLLAAATIILSLAMKRGVYAKWIAYFGFVTAALDIIGSYPWAIGPTLRLVCELSFAGWFVAVGSELLRMRASLAQRGASDSARNQVVG